MATVNYRDPVSGLWAELPTPVGPAGPAGPTGATGRTAVSADPGNAATIDADGIFVAPVTQADTDLLYVKVVGDTMTGALLLPDQSVTGPTVPTVASAKGYVDQLITVSDVDPDPVTDAPVRDGLVWNVIGDEVVAPPPPPLNPLAWYTAVNKSNGNNTVVWDPPADVSNVGWYEVFANTTGFPVGTTGSVDRVPVGTNQSISTRPGDVTYYEVYSVGLDGTTYSATGVQTLADTVPYYGSFHPDPSWPPFTVRPGEQRIELVVTGAEEAWDGNLGTIGPVDNANFRIATADGSPYSVDWGDGSLVETFPSGEKATHSFAGLASPVLVSITPTAGDLSEFKFGEQTAPNSWVYLHSGFTAVAIGAGTLTNSVDWIWMV